MFGVQCKKMLAAFLISDTEFKLKLSKRIAADDNRNIADRNQFLEPLATFCHFICPFENNSKNDLGITPAVSGNRIG